MSGSTPPIAMRDQLGIPGNETVLPEFFDLSSSSPKAPSDSDRKAEPSVAPRGDHPEPRPSDAQPSDALRRDDRPAEDGGGNERDERRSDERGEKRRGRSRGGRGRGRGKRDRRDRGPRDADSHAAERDLDDRDDHEEPELDERAESAEEFAASEQHRGNRDAPPAEPFLELGVDPEIARAVAEEGYNEPTEVQARSIPEAIRGRDLLGLAQTGTGKTAAFSIPILHRLMKHQRRGPRTIRALVLTPTRELAIQVHDSMCAYGRHLPLRSVVILGGVSAVPQIAELKKTPDVLVATPGRLLDLMDQGHITLDQIETFVLDEADRMLDMGFIHDVKKVVAKLPDLRQTLFFSATMPREVDQLAAKILNKPVRVEVSPPSTVPRKIEQKIFRVDRLDKRRLLAHLLKNEKGMRRILVFSRTKRRADTVVRHLKKIGISVAAIHSNKTQGARQKALGGFADGKVRVLVATDIMARGIDVDEITHVINYDLPYEPESYVHRIGRTARAGALGVAWSFCDGEEIPLLKQIERVMQSKLTIDEEQPFHSTHVGPTEPVEGDGGGRGGRGSNRGGGRDRSRSSGRGERRGGSSSGRGRRGGRSREEDSSRSSRRRGPSSRNEARDERDSMSRDDRNRTRSRARSRDRDEGFVEDSPRRGRRRSGGGRSEGRDDRRSEGRRGGRSDSRSTEGRRSNERRDDSRRRDDRRSDEKRSDERRSDGRRSGGRRDERPSRSRDRSDAPRRRSGGGFSDGIDDNFGDTGSLFGRRR